MKNTLAIGGGSNLHAVLRSATHAAHVRLNHHRLLSGLTRPGYGLETYRRVLRVYTHAYAELEARILAWLACNPQVFEYDSRRKHGWLQQDLDWFGDTPLAPSSGEVACPEVGSLGQLLGVLYPLEGATLGGQVISVHLERHLGLQAETGGRFFTGYGAGCDEQWRNFLAFLAGQQLDESEVEQARQNACKTFNYLEKLLDAAG